MWSLLVLVIVLCFSSSVYSFSTVLYESCGSSPSKKQKGCNPRLNRITNGVAAEEGEIPWQVSIITRYLGNDEENECGGSIISNNFVLTAAHCFNPIIIQSVRHEYDRERISVYAGGYKRIRSGTEYRIKSIIKHPDYAINKIGLINDLALLKMSKDFEFSSTIQPICLPFLKPSIPNIG
uniref:Serine protease 27like [Latimeria chalumnae] n=2 Tax=Lepeophtheirus salmonis TaxID=72036 RepID=A0A0K2TV18_LEPSM